MEIGTLVPMVQGYRKGLEDAVGDGKGGEYARDNEG